MVADETRGVDRGRRLVPKSAAQALRPAVGPLPPKRSRKARNQVVNFFNFLFSAALVLMVAGAAVVYWGKTAFDSPGPLETQATLVIPDGSGLSGIAASLERNGIISDARVFEAGVRVSGVAGELKAGEFGFEPHASMRAVMDALRSGASILHSVSIPEGWTVKQIYDRLAGEDVLTGDLPPLAPEGTLRPDTYRVQRGMTRGELVAKMSAAQSALVREIWDRREPKLPVKDIGEFVTLASIVERETGRADERPLVASVFINRLRKNMRLQSDPTSIYGVYAGQTVTDRALIQAAVQADTPYNTYKIKGLPPGPIANPGRAALEAVANPSETEDIYFVADGTGGHVFAQTLKEHNANVTRYNRARAAGAEAAADAPDAAPARDEAQAAQ